MSEHMSPLEREILTFMQNHGGGPFTDEDMDAGVLLQVHGLDYNGGGWEEAMEKASAWISLMEELREHSVIGTGCDGSAEHGRPYHLPETCLSEETAAQDWIAGVSAGSEEGAEVIDLIREMARSRWFTKYGSLAAEVMDQRIDWWIGWTCELRPGP